MGISDRRTLKHMKDPVRGVFRVSSWHDVYPGSPPPGDRIVGTISGPGIPDTAAEHKLDHHGHWPPGSELPITIDRRDPSKYVILWDEAPRGIGDAMRAMQSRQPGQDLFGLLQDVMAQQQQHHQRHLPGEPVVMTSGTSMDMSQLPPDTAARVQAAMSEMFGAFGGNFGGMAGGHGGINEAHIARLEHLAERMGGANGARISGIIDTLRQAAATSGTTTPQYDPPQYGPPQTGVTAPQDAAPHGGFTADQAQGFLAGGAGQPATAVVAEVTDVEPEFGAFPPPGGIVDIRLEITKPDGSFSVATTRIGFSSPERRAAVATVGNRLQVRVDPLNPANVVIDPQDPS